MRLIDLYRRDKEEEEDDAIIEARAKAAEEARKFPINPLGRLIVAVQTAIGYTLTTISLTAIVLLVIMGFLYHFITYAIIAFVILAIVGFLISLSGTLGLRTFARFYKYVHWASGHTDIQVSELAEKNGKSVAFTLKDLQKMIDSQMFPQGHLDTEHAHLYLTNDAYATAKANPEKTQS